MRRMNCLMIQVPSGGIWTQTLCGLPSPAVCPAYGFPAVDDARRKIFWIWAAGRSYNEDEE